MATQIKNIKSYVFLISKIIQSRSIKTTNEINIVIDSMHGIMLTSFLYVLVLLNFIYVKKIQPKITIVVEKKRKRFYPVNFIFTFFKNVEYRSLESSNLISQDHKLDTTLKENIKSIRDFKIDGINYGEFILSGYIRNTRSSPNYQARTFKKHITKSLEYWHSAKNIYKEKKFDYAFMSHTSYHTFGSLFLNSLAANTFTVVLTPDHEYFTARSYSKITDFTNILRNYPRSLDDKTSSLVLKPENINMNKIEKYFNERITGEDKFFEGNYQKPIKNFHTFFKEKILSKSKNYKKIVLIASHQLWDDPLGNYKMIYDDYYSWLRETLILASMNRNVLWFIKPHPAERERGTNESCEDIYNEVLRGKKNENIILLDSGFSSSSIFRYVDFILTVRGTISLEGAASGVMPVTAGTGPISGYNLDISSNNIDEYEKIMMTIHLIDTKLSEEQITKSKVLLYNYINKVKISNSLKSLLHTKNFKNILSDSSDSNLLLLMEFLLKKRIGDFFPMNEDTNV